MGANTAYLELFFSCVCNDDGSTTVPYCSGCEECGKTPAGNRACMHPMNPENLKCNTITAAQA